MNTYRSFVLAALAAMLVLGCVGSAPEDFEGSAEELASDDAEHYFARRDTNRCRWPLCGGYWIRRANRAQTRCDDGRMRRECYVASIDHSESALSPEQTSALESAFAEGRAIIEGTIERGSAGELGTYALLRTQRGWVAATDAPVEEVLYSVLDNGRRCIRSPCFSLDQAKLNGSDERTISGLDLEALGLSEEQHAAAIASLATEGLIAAGHDVRNRRTGAVTLVASAAFIALEAARCESDAECTLTFHPAPVRSAEECYCPECPTPALASEAEANRASWETFCAATHGPDVCLPRPCARPPAPGCNAGVCGFGSGEI